MKTPQDKIFCTDRQAERAVFKIELEDSIAKFVRGIRKERDFPVSKKQITEHIRKFPMFMKVTEDEIENAIDEGMSSNRFHIVGMSLTSYRTHNGSYGYMSNGNSFEC